MTDAAPDRKPRLLWLLAPLGLVLVAAVAWSAYWAWLSRETAARLDAAKAALKRRIPADLGSRQVSGYPFR
jgi:hypothetical protein